MTGTPRDRKTGQRGTRAGLVAALAVAMTASCATAQDAAPAASTTTAAATARPAAGHSGRAFRGLEHRYDAHLGVWALDTGNGRTVTWHADERFAYASTHKVLSAATVLRRMPHRLGHVVHYTRADLVDYSPITEKHVGTGMTIRALCDAALRYSDNTAANLLFRQIGGPKGLTAELREIGDRTTMPSRIEPHLNDATPGDVRDTSTPRAMGTDLRKLSLGAALPAGQRAVLNGWMRRNTTGGTLIRAGVPATWTVGDKTGSGGYGTRNDIAVAWRPHRAPVVIVIMSKRDEKDADYHDALIAKAATTVTRGLG